MVTIHENMLTNLIENLVTDFVKEKLELIMREEIQHFMQEHAEKPNSRNGYYVRTLDTKYGKNRRSTSSARP